MRGKVFDITILERRALIHLVRAHTGAGVDETGAQFVRRVRLPLLLQLRHLRHQILLYPVSGV